MAPVDYLAMDMFTPERKLMQYGLSDQNAAKHHWHSFPRMQMQHHGHQQETLNANITSIKADIENDAGQVESSGADIASLANVYGNSGRASESCLAGGQRRHR